VKDENILLGTQYKWEDDINPLAPNDECAASQGGGLNCLTPQHMHQPLLVILVQTCWDFFLLLFPFFLSCFLFPLFVCWGVRAHGEFSQET